MWLGVRALARYELNHKGAESLGRKNGGGRGI